MNTIQYNYSILFFSKITTLLFILLACFATPISAQDLGLSMMTNLHQTNTLNPATMTDRKFIFSFPGVTGSVGSSDLTYNKLTTTNEAGETIIKANDLVASLRPQNTIWSNTSLEIFHLSFGSNRWQISMGHAIKMNNNVTIPKTLAQLVLQGNEQFLGETVNIAPQFNMTSYSEWSIATAINYGRLTLGLRAKLLGGLSNFSSGNAVANIHTNDQSIYELTLASDYTIRSAGLIEITGLEDENEEIELTTGEIDLFNALFGENKGFAFDLGATFKVSDKLTVTGSIIDLGKITWSKNANTYTSKGDYEYKGLDVLDLLKDEDTNLSQIADTLTDIFKFNKKQDNYSTGLTVRSYWTANYQLSEKFTVGGLIHTRHHQGTFDPTFAVNGAMNMGRWWTLGAIVSQGKSTGFSVGVNTALRLGPVQLFFATDNLPGLIKPLDHGYAHGRVGMNLAFGKREA